MCLCKPSHSRLPSGSWFWLFQGFTERTVVSHGNCLYNYFSIMLSIAFTFSHSYNNIQGSRFLHVLSDTDLFFCDLSCLWVWLAFLPCWVMIWIFSICCSLMHLLLEKCLAYSSFCPFLNQVIWAFGYQAPYIFCIWITCVMQGLQTFSSVLSLSDGPFIFPRESVL